MAYNRVAGQSVERLAALSDGIFAIAMTLLVLDLTVPAVRAIHDERELWQALVALSPRLVSYVLSFMVLGLFWIGQQTQFTILARSDRNLAWLQIGFFLAVALMPFSTDLLAQFITYRIALLTYWLNIVLLGATLFASLAYASRAGLIKGDGVSPKVRDAIFRRIVVAQSLYALGAALCVVNTYWSIAAIVLVQLNFMIGSPIRFLDRS